MKSLHTLIMRGSIALAIGVAAINSAYAKGSDDLNASGVKLRGDGTVDDTQPASAVNTPTSGGVKLRGDGSVDDTQPGVTTNTPSVSTGLKLRGDGTVDDTQPGVTTNTPSVSTGLKLRGDGTVDDTQPGATTANPGLGGVKLRGDGSVDDSPAATTRTRTFVTTRDAVGNAVTTRTEQRFDGAGVLVRERVKIERPSVADDRITGIDRMRRGG